MPARIYLFYAVQLLAAAYALRRGGAPERWTAWMMLAATIVSSVLPFHPQTDFTGVEWNQFAIDGALLVGLLALALRADRYWPIWLAAIQLLAVAMHAVRAYDESLLPAVYNRLLGKFAYPMIALLVIGTIRHWQRRVAGKPERDWSPLVWH